MLRLTDIKARLAQLLTSPVIQHGQEVQIPPPTYRWTEPSEKVRVRP